MKPEISYTYRKVDHCNMCHSAAVSFKVLGKRLNRSQGRNPRKLKGVTSTICKCKKCSLIFPNPLPIPQNIQDHYGIPPEDYWKEEYFTVQPGYFSNEIEIAKNLLPFKNGMKCLDIGAGLGKGMIALTNAGFDVYGLEPSIPFAKRAVEKMGIQQDRLKVGMVEELEYPENEFDFITFGAVVEHLYDPELCIQKAMKWLKPEGIIHIEVPSSKWLVSKIANTYYKLIGTNFVANLSPMHEPFHLYEFGLSSFEQNGKLNGYSVASYQFHVCETFMPRIADFMVKPIMKITNTGLQLTVWLRKN